ncbi:MAG TPA: Uma2 family endonuclease [Thermodesulfobacteriota bacterium]|nr:Uma2 family endonuclease [Thermodesulfobacteriota bacterium]
MSVQVTKRYFNITEYYRMAEVGILSEDDRVELIKGEIIRMAPIGSRHAGCVSRLNNLLSRQVGEAALVSVQNPVRLSDFSEPQPDIMLLKPRDDFYSNEHPTPADVLLIVEVSDTSLEYDRDIKLPLYAAASVQEVWLVNLIKETVEIYRDSRSGMYREVRYATHGESVSPQFNPNLVINIDAILG